MRELRALMRKNWRDFGLDLTLSLVQLRLPPAERARQMLEVCRLADQVPFPNRMEP
jgi:hypothetical protein